MRITKIEIKDFRAFKGVPTALDLSPGKNLLVYGENGSGKSSLFLALKYFLEREKKSHDFTANQNIFVTTDDGYIKLTLNATGDAESGLYEWSKAVNDTNKPLILETDKTKGFIDYKALLATYFLQHDKLAVNIFDLLIQSILPNVTDDLTKKSFGEDWRAVQQALPTRNTKTQVKYVEAQLKSFNDGLKNKLIELRTQTEKILEEFGYDVSIAFHFDGVTYNRASRKVDKGFNGKDVILKVKFCNKEKSNHHHFLNEAKLSAIAISIFFAALLLQPSSRLKILALDDVLIGLDMQNRMPVIDILKKYFNDYQVFMLTYDETWFAIVKRHFPGNGWKKIEFFAGKTPEGEVPVFADSKNYIEKAKGYFNLPAPDYGSCVNYLRKHFEQVAGEFCERQRLSVKVAPDQDLTRIPSKAYWDVICAGQAAGKWPGLAKTLLNDIEIYRTFILNPYSHANSSAAYKSEIQRSITAVEALELGLAAIK
jgi:energy-coupling factor transporter ATP-binding protein EcfA2